MVFRFPLAAGLLGLALTLGGVTPAWSQETDTAVPVPSEILPRVEIAPGPPPAVPPASFQIPRLSPLGNRRALDFLAQPMGVSFAATPLEDVLSALEQSGQISIRIEKLALADLGVPVTVPVTINVPESTKVEILLDRVLHPLKLNYFVDDLGIVVTSMEDEQARMFPRVYRFPTGAIGEHVLRMMTDMLPRAIDPNSWSEMGGPASLTVIENHMIIRQSFANHRRIERVLNAYQQRIAATAQSPERMAIDPVIDPQTQVRLRRPLGEQAPEFDETPLGEVIDTLAAATGTTLHLDASISELGIDREFPISVNFQADATGEAALREVLTRLELITQYSGNLVAIMPVELATDRLSLRYYTVPVATIGQGYTSVGGRLEHPEAVKLWVNLIERTVAPGTWRLEGGPGYVTLDAPTNMLFVLHTDQVHREIERLLDELLDPQAEEATPAETTDET